MGVMIQLKLLKYANMSRDIFNRFCLGLHHRICSEQNMPSVLLSGQQSYWVQLVQQCIQDYFIQIEYESRWAQIINSLTSGEEQGG